MICRILIFLVFFGAKSQLIKDIEKIIKSKNAKVGVAISKNGKNYSINGNEHFPMQSVFKFHIGIYMLSEIDKGHFGIDQKVTIHKNELLPGLYSPLREANPEGGSFSISELMKYSVSLSDNVACDVLLKLLGGPKKVENYFKKLGFKDLSIKINEETMQANWDLQFNNWSTANTTNGIQKLFFENKNKLLSTKSYEFLWKTMKETSTGPNRIKGLLPKGTTVAHKTGYSGQNKQTGISAATNDVGIVFLPNGSHYFLSVYVSESKEDNATNEKIIAEIAKATWDYFVKN